MQPNTQPRDVAPRRLRDYELKEAIPFIAIHLAVFGVLWSGVSLGAAIACVALYFIRMFAVTAGYHRYFSHRTFRTSRAFQFILAVLAQTSAQKGVVWWAAHHRRHHKHSDDVLDPHSPVQRGFWYAHLGWIFDHTGETDERMVRDLLRYPELRWLNRHYLVPPTVLALALLATLGWSGFFVGFMLSTVLLWHGTFVINSLAHVIGRRRFATKDESRNSLILALITLGEGWHNNHHRYPGSTRQGFRWWEIDVTYYILRGLQALRIVWDLREPPDRIRLGADAPSASPPLGYPADAAP